MTDVNNWRGGKWEKGMPAAQARALVNTEIAANGAKSTSWFRKP
jgi:hypothetical protein